MELAFHGNERAQTEQNEIACNYTETHKRTAQIYVKHANIAAPTRNQLQRRCLGHINMKVSGFMNAKKGMVCTYCNNLKRHIAEHVLTRNRRDIYQELSVLRMDEVSQGTCIYVRRWLKPRMQLSAIPMITITPHRQFWVKLVQNKLTV